VHLERGLDAAGDDLGVEAPRGAARDPAVEHDRHLVGAAEGELVAQELLEPGPAGLGAVEHPGVGELELAEGEQVAVAAAAILRREGRRQARLPAAQEALDVPDREARRDPLKGGASAQQRKPLSRASKATPARSAWRLAHS
jgi:hypothetical protein